MLTIFFFFLSLSLSLSYLPCLTVQSLPIALTMHCAYSDEDEHDKLCRTGKEELCYYMHYDHSRHNALNNKNGERPYDRLVKRVCADARDRVKENVMTLAEDQESQACKELIAV